LSGFFPASLRLRSGSVYQKPDFILHLNDKDSPQANFESFFLELEAPFNPAESAGLEGTFNFLIDKLLLLLFN